VTAASEALSFAAGERVHSLANDVGFEKYLPAAPANDAGFTTVGGLNIPLGSLTFNSPSYTNSYNALVSLDYNLSDKDQIRGRWIYNKSDGLQYPASLPAFNVNSPNNNYLLSVSEFHNFTPTLQNEFRSSFSRNVNRLGVPNITFPGMNVFPVITIDDQHEAFFNDDFRVRPNLTLNPRNTL
jgi:hypothetical protein